jgi:hypothetical protein
MGKSPHDKYTGVELINLRGLRGRSQRTEAKQHWGRHTQNQSTLKELAVAAFAAWLLTMPLQARQSENGAAVSGGSSAAAQAAASGQQVQEVLQELDGMKKRTEQLEAELNPHAAAEPPTTAVDTAKATTPATIPPSAITAPSAEAEAPLSTGPHEKEKATEPFAFADWA